MLTHYIVRLLFIEYPSRDLSVICCYIQNAGITGLVYDHFYVPVIINSIFP